ncbi:MAG: orotidine-5'-phosphate decarboxylase [Candidatus Pelethousia sp.]|nr:orotidine-5'-phosphate decarboxylase [Candidatus Pelethousia sp.]
MDKLIAKIDAFENPSVVGLDPTLQMIPAHIKNEMFARYGKTPLAIAEMFIRFNKGIIDAVQDIVPAVKPQIAMYERFGLEGLRAYMETIRMAREAGFYVIGDIKRGDIASTAQAYAAHIDGTDVEEEEYDLWQEDAITINPYFGYDGIEPFIAACNAKNRCIFALVKTSNPSSAEIQDLDSNGVPVYERVAALVSQWGEEAMGASAYSRIGAVIGATHKAQGERLRALMPRTFFLVPGYGAQGGSAEDIRGFFDNEGRGCIVNSSRGIIAAYKADARYGEENFADAARSAALAMRKALRY